ncbi:MAG: MerC domain-containing protein [Lentisphaeraceae bacterium]|nr:MerC domain-containing protein [Lentisphaeraceae bacterium]
MKKLLNFDCLGIAASLLCLVHCMFLPWVVAILGTYFASSVKSPYFHQIMLVIALLIGLPVFIGSFIKFRSKLILATGVIGLSLTTIGTMKDDSCCPETSVSSECEASCSHSLEYVADSEKETLVQGFNTIPLGVSLLILAHFLNFRQKRKCKYECCH